MESLDVVRMQFGSHLYGTDTPASDLDYKSVHLPPARDILLQRVTGTVSTKRPKAEGEKNVAGEIDEESYALHRFFQLVAEGQTVALDMLFAPPSSLVLTSRMWEQIVFNRPKLLCRKSAAFIGYCKTQANKYGIKGSRVAAAKAAMEFFAGLTPFLKLAEVDPSYLEAFVGTHEHMAIVELPTVQGGVMLKHFECCNKKVPFTCTVKSAYELYSRIYQEYGHRARMAQANQGIDWKALSHAVRVGYEALELLKDHTITFPLPNAPHILRIKQGLVSYDQVAEEIEALLLLVENVAAVSTLPEKPDTKLMDDMVEYYYRYMVNTHRMS